MIWQPAPPEAVKAGSAHQGHGGNRGGKRLLLSNGEGADAEMWLPTRVRRSIDITDGGVVRVGGTGVDNYHLLYAKKSDKNRVEVALRYLYQHGKPSGESPSALVNHLKAALDIVPAPLTREHQRYQSGKPFSFMVRFDEQYLSDKAVKLITSNGSEFEGRTDEKGYITLQLPEDFAEVQAGRSNNRPAEFVLSVAHEAQGVQFRTTLSAPYYVNPSHWRSTGGGLAAMFAGMLTGFVVLRRSRDNKTGRG